MLPDFEEILIDHFEDISDQVRNFIRNNLEIRINDNLEDLLEVVRDIETQGYELDFEVLDEYNDLFVLHLKRNGMIYDSLELTIYGLI